MLIQIQMRMRDQERGRERERARQRLRHLWRNIQGGGADRDSERNKRLQKMRENNTAEPGTSTGLCYKKLAAVSLAVL